MSERLKRWESPRKQGRNDKGKGGSARQRQLKKRTQMLRQKLKEQGNGNNNQNQTKANKQKKGEDKYLLLSFFINPPVANLEPEPIDTRAPEIFQMF